MKFRPCLDLYQGKVRQIVGKTLNSTGEPTINFTADKDPSWYANLYKENNLTDGHLVMLGEGNVEAAKLALNSYPGGFRVGGGINDNNAKHWLDQGAAAIIITSFLFNNLEIDWQRLKNINQKVGRNHLIIDLSTSNDEQGNFWIYLDGWKRRSEQQLTLDLLNKLNRFASGFVIHSISKEGLSSGIDAKLLDYLGQYKESPVVYGGGVSNLEDIKMIDQKSDGHIDFTVGSALDIFGGNGLKFNELVARFK